MTKRNSISVEKAVDLIVKDFSPEQLKKLEARSPAGHTVSFRNLLLMSTIKFVLFKDVVFLIFFTSYCGSLRCGLGICSFNHLKSKDTDTNTGTLNSKQGGEVVVIPLKPAIQEQKAVETVKTTE